MGSNISWEYYNGVLSISGKGALESSTDLNDIPWYGIKDKITSIQISNTITGIGDAAFVGCQNLVSVTIPSSVTKIGSAAFSGCRKLPFLVIPNSVNEISYSAFTRCHTLSITIPERFRGKVYLSDCSKVTYYSNEKEIPSSMDATQNQAKEEKWIKLSSIKKSDLARYEFTKMRVTFDRTSVSTYCYVQIGYVDTKTTALEFAFSSRYPYYINLNRTQPSAPFTSKGKEVVNYVYEYDLNELCGTKNRKFYVRSWQENFIPEQVEILIKQERQAKLEEANRVEPEPEPEPYLPTLEELVEQKIRELENVIL